MRRSYSGAAQTAKLTSDLGGSTANLTIYCDDLTNWPTGTGGYPFYVVIDRGKSTEEKILCASRTGNIISVYDNGVTNGRAADGTSITSHTANSVIEHCMTATDADEANAHVNSSTNVHGVSSALVGVSDTQTLTNKTITGGTVNATTLQQSGVAAVTVSGTQTLTNKTLTSPTISSPTISGTTSAEGIVLSSAQALTSRTRNIAASTSAPTSGDGNDGDMWVVYV